MQLYTIIADYNHRTYLSQFEVGSPTQALIQWVKKFDFKINNDNNENIRNVLLKEFSVEELIPIDTLSNVWRAYSSVNKEFLLIHIVETNNNAI